MTTYTVTITSKNQITLPVKLVRKYNFTKGQQLELQEVGTGIRLKKEPTFQEKMQPLWDKVATQLEGKTPPTNEELSRAARDIWASGEVEFR